MFPSSHRAALARRRPSGFTLVELAVTLVIFSTLLALGAVGMSEMTVRMQQRNLARGLVDALAATRFEALKRNQRVTVCPSADGQACTSNRWEEGWIIFADDNDSGAREEGEGVIATRSSGSSPRVTASGNKHVANYVSFVGSGMPLNKNGGLQMGTFTVCRKGGEAIHVVFAISGRARMEFPNKKC